MSTASFMAPTSSSNPSSSPTATSCAPAPAQAAPSSGQSHDRATSKPAADTVTSAPNAQGVARDAKAPSAAQFGPLGTELATHEFDLVNQDFINSLISIPSNTIAASASSGAALGHDRLDQAQSTMSTPAGWATSFLDAQAAHASMPGQVATTSTGPPNAGALPGASHGPGTANPTFAQPSLPRHGPDGWPAASSAVFAAGGMSTPAFEQANFAFNFNANGGMGPAPAGQPGIPPSAGLSGPAASAANGSAMSHSPQGPSSTSSGRPHHPTWAQQSLGNPSGRPPGSQAQGLYRLAAFPYITPGNGHGLANGSYTANLLDTALSPFSPATTTSSSTTLPGTMSAVASPTKRRASELGAEVYSASDADFLGDGSLAMDDSGDMSLSFGAGSAHTGMRSTSSSLAPTVPGTPIEGNLPASSSALPMTDFGSADFQRRKDAVRKRRLTSEARRRTELQDGFRQLRDVLSRQDESIDARMVKTELVSRAVDRLRSYEVSSAEKDRVIGRLQRECSQLRMLCVELHNRLGGAENRENMGLAMGGPVLGATALPSQFGHQTQGHGSQMMLARAPLQGMLPQHQLVNGATTSQSVGPSLVQERDGTHMQQAGPVSASAGPLHDSSNHVGGPSRVGDAGSIS